MVRYHLALVDACLANPALVEGLSVYELDMKKEHDAVPMGSRTKTFNFKVSPKRIVYEAMNKTKAEQDNSPQLENQE